MRKVSFAEFNLDIELFELRKNGKLVEVGGRTLDLLVYLIEHRERVVENEELRNKVWQSAALSRSSIPTCVRELRIALDDDAANPRFIETSRGRGYRFIGEIRWIELGLADADSGSFDAPVNLPFVGRKKELKEIRKHFQHVTAEGRLRLLLIRGTAGIGKSRTLNEFLSSLPADKIRYLARSPGLEDAPSFWPWIQVMKDLLKQRGDGLSPARNHESILAFIYPELTEYFGATLVAPSHLDRHAILKAWVETIRSASQGEPIIIAIEDIHQLDPDSLELMEWLVHELENEPFLLIATHRPRASSSQIATRIGRIYNAENSSSLELAPLDGYAISEMLDPLIDGRKNLARALQYRTQGNPFYITHLIRTIGQQKLSAAPDSSLSKLPPNAKEIVSRQLSDLPESCFRALSYGSIAGDSFRSLELADAMGIAASTLVSNLEPALVACFLIETGEGYRFAHSILRDALYDSLSTSDRKSFHLATAEALQRKVTAPHDTARIAEHLIQASPLSDTRTTCRFVVEAGRNASLRFSFPAAQRFFQIAVSMMEDLADFSTEARCHLMLDLARAQLYEGDRDSSRATLFEAAALARENHLPDVFSEAALCLAPDFLSIEVGIFDPSLIRLLREALGLIDQRNRPLKAKLLARLSLALSWSGDQDKAASISAESLRLAQESEDTEALAQALSARSDALHGIDRSDERAKAVEALGIAVGESGGLPDLMMHQVRQVAVSLELGDMSAVDAAIIACERLSQDMGVRQFLWYPIAFQAMRSIMIGDFDRANRLGEEFIKIGQKTNDQNVVNSRACQACHILVETNRIELAIPPASDLARNHPMARSWTAGVGWLHCLANQETDAVRILNAFDERAYTSLSKEVGGSAGIAFLSVVAARFGNSKQKKSLYALCTEGPSRAATLGFGMTYLGTFSRYAGLLAESMGDYSSAHEHFTLAISLEQIREARICRATAEVDLARMFTQAGRNHIDATALLASAAETARESKHHRLLREIEDLSARTLA